MFDVKGKYILEKSWLVGYNGIIEILWSGKTFEVQLVFV